MKLLHIVYSLVNGGIETMLVNVANEQINNHSVYIMIINNIVDERLLEKLDGRIKVIRINRNIKFKFDNKNS